MGFKNARRGTTFAAQSAAMTAAEVSAVFLIFICEAVVVVVCVCVCVAESKRAGISESAGQDQGSWPWKTGRVNILPAPLMIFTYCTQPSIKGLESGGLQIVSIQDVTPVPHNGCRPRKARRL